VAIFAISEPLIYYAAEVKQYELDVATTVCLWWICTALMSRLDNADLAAWALVTIVGATAIWISHPAIFVVGGIAAQVLCQAAVGRRPRLLVAGACSSGVWLVTFFALYLISLRFFSPTLADAWFGTVAPAGPEVAAGSAGAAGAAAFEYVVAWLRDTVRFRDTVWTLAVLPLGQHAPKLVALCAALGVIALLWRRRDRQWAWFAAAVVLACLAASVRKYPITPRLWLFLAPAMMLLIAAGVDELWRRTRRTFPVLAPLLACLLLFYPAVAAARGALWPPQKEEVRPLLAYVRDHYRPGDVLYVYRYAGPAARYYAATGLRFAGDVVRELDAADWRYHAERNLEALRGRNRVWVLLSHVETEGDTDHEKLLVHMLDRLGVRLDGKRLPGASLHLYDLSRTP
jgi:hypothetical protein